MALPERMKFGIFLAPFHRLGENPTLAIERDLELVQWLDTLGFDEAWIGEHHSAGWETIASPDIFIGIAAERTRHIKLGTGVISLPYHHPLMVANRMVLLDHMTRGRVMLGVGPGALVSDAYMLGIEPTTQREKMDESLGVIVRLLTETEPISHESSWFELHDAVLHLQPYQRPHMPIAVAAAQSPSGPALAGKHGAAMLSVSVPRDPGQSDLTYLWDIAEESAAEHGKTVKRDEWRLVVPVHLAESRKEAMEDARMGAGYYQREYFEETLGMKSGTDGPVEKIIDNMVEGGQWVIGTPDDCIAAIKRFDERSGGFGGLLVQTIDWAPREKMLHSYELLARHVMPHFQSSLLGVTASNQWSRDHAEELMDFRVRSIDRAKQAWAERR
ncbi:MAG: LLM class flavin-dependent oxidoreductase [Dehalococcoidia bacterium]|nr:LLM class flavin-dependent oxidoreductase [Dehalococcoidia bacterium]